MNKRSTKANIIDCALNLFARQGYTDVSMNAIADGVGIKAASLYKHFSGKQAIFDAIVEKMSCDYAEKIKTLPISAEDILADAQFYQDIHIEDLVAISKDLFLFYRRDPYMCKFRMMLTVEQFRQTEIANLYTKIYYDDALKFHTGIFTQLIRCGLFEESDPESMALQFYSPFYFLLTMCDRHPERESKALFLLDQHIRQFSCAYKNIHKY